ncbi:T9SS type A sorting domain-containing protein [Pontimicrobium sp. MEBiC06410]
MKRKITILFVFLVSVIGYSQTENTPLDVLFVGNSITYFNNLPQTFEAIAEEQGYQIDLDQHTPGGTGFVHHVNNAALYQKFRDRTWDYVVLQPGSNESPGFSYSIDQTIERGKQLRDSILKYSPCASIYYYEIAYGIVDDTQASFDQYLERSQLIKDNITQMSNETGIPLAPVGECFKTSMLTDDSEFLWGGYGDIHPNAKGSFLGACTFYNALFKKEIINSNVNAGLTNEEANYFRGIAQDVMLNNLDDWNISSLTATALFTIEAVNDGSVNFINQSSNYDADAVLWDFGDGQTSTDINPNHTFDFNAASTYQVVLTVSKNCKEHHHILNITQEQLSVNTYELVSNDIKVLPNPTTDFVTITSNNNYDLEVYNLLGAKVLKTKAYNNKHINLKSLQKGVYLFRFYNEESNNSMVKKIVVK